MHDLKVIYGQVKRLLKHNAKDYFDSRGNHRFYPRLPKLSDLEIISLSITAEVTQIDSENLLWSKLKTDYSTLFTSLPHRTTFNRRRKNLRFLTERILFHVGQLIDDKIPSKCYIVDSMPIPTCKIAREFNTKACRNAQHDEVLADKSRNASLGEWYIGYKLHLITTDQGVFKDYMVSCASMHDSQYLKEINATHRHLANAELIGDRAYIGRATQLSLFENLELRLNIPYRRNQKDYKPYDPTKRILRKRIETVFSQFCDEFNIKRNYAKRFDGLYIRIVTKLAAKTIKQFINLLRGKPINQTKHAFASQ